MSSREKLLAWGCDRLERHEHDMDSLLVYLYAERSQQPQGESDQELEGLIQAIEAQREQTEHTRHRLMPGAVTGLNTPSLPTGEADDQPASASHSMMVFRRV